MAINRKPKGNRDNRLSKATSGGSGNRRKKAVGKTVDSVPGLSVRKKRVVRTDPRIQHNKPAPKPPTDSEDMEQGERLQKVLAMAGYGSRRECELLITAGRVTVDGKVAKLGVKVFLENQEVRIDGEAIPKKKTVYIAVNKPKGFICTNRDQQGRRRAVDLVPPQLGRLFPVGRLDMNSEGLLIMTNDGVLAQRLTHPSYEVPKKYRVQVAGLVEQSLVRDLKKGIYLAEGIVQADDVVLKSCHKQSSILEIVLTEGKNREIRRMLARLGHKVMQLQRIAIGSIKLGKMVPGEYRHLTKSEVKLLYR